MNESNDEFLNTEAVSHLAENNLPSHYRLLEVTFTYGSSMPHHPKQMEIRIEYQSLLDDAAEGAPDAIKAHQRWAFPLLERIRTEWPPDAVRVVFSQKSAPP